VREVGRGGMGVVYEAEQLSLGRRVALKVLPFAATMDPRHLQRFQNEARAAASLHHEHIVPVHAVGQERGVHYYAMQFIDGLTLAQFLERQRQGGQSPRPDEPTADHAPAASPSADTSPQACATTVPAPRDAAYFRRVAEWGVQAAEALEHAHQLGIVHRDVKPGNLMLDGQGKLWVTDFGLARVGADSGLTLTGDLVGTLRYMSPEQALAKRVVLDHRTDIYSLGVTLYELLTGQPAVRGNTREEILRQIVFGEPKPPRQLNRAIPTDLETIILKAMAPEPERRYATAQELADDLRRFLEGRPVQARRPTAVQRARRWARRNRTLVGALAAGLALALAVLAGSVGWVLRDQAARQALAEEKVREALAVLEPGLQQGNPHAPDVVRAARQAEAHLASGLVGPELRQRAEQLLADLAMLAKLEQIRLDQAAGKDGHFDIAGADPAYAAAFRSYGVNVEALELPEAAARLRGRVIAAHLVAALIDWAEARRSRGKEGGQGWQRLLEVARAADPERDAWRAALCEALARGGRKEALEKLVARTPFEKLPATTLALLGRALRDSGAVESAVAVLREGQRRHPGDFWLNHDLAFALGRLKLPQLDEAIGYYRAALALRPRSPTVHVSFGIALDNSGRSAEALQVYRQAIDLEPGSFEAHNNLGLVLNDLGKHAEAVKALRRAIELRPGAAGAHYNLGIALDGLGKHVEAVKAYRQAIHLKPDHAKVHNNLGKALNELGKHAEAARALRRAIELKPDNVAAHINLGNALAAKGRGDVEGAIACYKQALSLKPDSPQAYYNLGLVLNDLGKHAEAVKALRRAIELKPDYTEAHYDLGNGLLGLGKHAEAIKAYRQAIHLRPDYYKAYGNLGNALCGLGNHAEAVKAYRRVIELRPDDAGAHNNLGLALSALGKHTEAVKAYRRVIELKPDDANAHNNLGNALNEVEEHAEAVRVFRRAVELKPDFTGAHYNLGNTLRGLGEHAEAAKALRRAIDLKPDFAEAHCNYGGVLRDQGKLIDSLAAYRRGHELGSKRHGWDYPSARWVRAAERLVKLDARLQDILGGKEQPADAAERVALAELCHLKRLYRQATHFYEEAFAEEPGLADDLQRQPRYNAARAAALAGCGQGKDAAQCDAKERARLRRQALDWLRADLAAYRRLLDEEPAKVRTAIGERLRRWQQDKDFTGVRDASALAKLPEAERLDWRRLWEEVEALRQRAAGPPKRASPARP
jgi:tetratricopeptide (TPR) repeat protein